MKPVILFRRDHSTEEEFEIAKKYFEVKELRSEIEPDSCVIGRYSTLPYYRELERDLECRGSDLVNSSRQYNWIANFDWYYDLEKYTFETWFRAQDVPDIPLVVKGRTNSRKHEWNKKMFAKNKKEAIDIMIELQSDSLIAPQGIIFRRYEPLVTFDYGIASLPFTEEYRVFFYKERILSHAYYWSQAKDFHYQLPEDGLKFAQLVGDVVAKGSFSNFYVCDIARKENGEWVLVEINDGQMSGLSENKADVLYNNLRKAYDEI